MCFGCFSNSGNGNTFAPQRVQVTPYQTSNINCGVSRTRLVTLGAKIESERLESGDSGLTPIIEEIRHYILNYNSTDLCAELSKIELLEAEYE